MLDLFETPQQTILRLKATKSKTPFYKFLAHYIFNKRIKQLQKKK